MRQQGDSDRPKMRQTGGICPSCFRAGIYGSVCAFCGLDLEKEPVRPLALRYLHSLRNGSYITGRVLGQGGFGITYLCLRGQTRCCIKEYVPDDLNCRREPNGPLLIPRENIAEFNEGKELFLDEARVLQQFRDFPGIVDIWDYFEENGTCYFAMEYLDGCNLRTYQRRNAKDHEALKVAANRAVAEIGSALQELHKSGLIHGDVSPENIMFTKDGAIKLIDFGTARLYRSAAARKGIRTFVKSGYAPFEMYLPDQRVGPWSDVYSLAATYYAVLTGVKVPDARDRMQQDTYQPLARMCPDISPSISRAVDRALIPDYRRRTPSMEAFVSEFMAAARGDGPENEIRSARPVYLEMHVGTAAQCSWRITPDTVMTVGRRRESDIVLPTDTMLSRYHCDLRYSTREHCLWVTDHSARGTYRMDGRRLPKDLDSRIEVGEEFFLAVPRYIFKITEE